MPEFGNELEILLGRLLVSRFSQFSLQAFRTFVSSTPKLVAGLVPALGVS